MAEHRGKTLHILSVCILQFANRDVLPGGIPPRPAFACASSHVETMQPNVLLIPNNAPDACCRSIGGRSILFCGRYCEIVVRVSEEDFPEKAAVDAI